MNYRKYFRSGEKKVLVNLQKASDSQIYNKIQRVLYYADVNYRQEGASIYDDDNIKRLYQNNVQFRVLLQEGTNRLSIMIELDEVYAKLR